ncbi:MAG: hypothetical protein IPO91_06940 [Chloroflexi bacterium]|nr:hypothetical protein [Chloroflexota bacterium]
MSEKETPGWAGVGARGLIPAVTRRRQPAPWRTPVVRGGGGRMLRMTFRLGNCMVLVGGAGAFGAQLRAWRTERDPVRVPGRSTAKA